MRRGQQSRVIRAAGGGGVLCLLKFNEVSMQIGSIQHSQHGSSDHIYYTEGLCIRVGDEHGLGWQCHKRRP